MQIRDRRKEQKATESREEMFARDYVELDMSPVE